jgi:hypothetical protein
MLSLLGKPGSSHAIAAARRHAAIAPGSPPNPPPRWTLVLLSAGMAVASVGCQHSPPADRRTRMRTEKMQATARVWAKSEQGRPAKVRRALEFIPQDLERQRAALKRSAAHVEDWQKRDFERWRQRQRVYLDEAGRILWGKPEQIERNAIILFY